MIIIFKGPDILAKFICSICLCILSIKNPVCLFVRVRIIIERYDHYIACGKIQKSLEFTIFKRKGNHDIITV